jgi:protein ImuB
VASIAREFSPRYECHRDDLVSIDVSGLERVFLRRSVLDTREGDGPSASGVGAGPHASQKNPARSVWRVIGEELRREAASRRVRVHVAVAGSRMAALVLAHARPGVTIVEPDGEAGALAPLAIGILEKVIDDRPQTSDVRLQTFAALKRWGLKTLGELAALPSADLASRLGRQALVWQAIARGDDVRPLVPTLEEERFESSMELEWPIEGLEPLSFVLTRLLEPLSTRLERRDRGAAVLHVLLRLVTKDVHARRLELPAPMRDVRALRTLALLDLESHPPAGAIDRVAIVIDPTPGRVLQHTLFTRAQPTPEQVSTLLARLGALMGQDRLGAPATVDSDRPGAFAMMPFATEHHHDQRRTRGTRREQDEQDSALRQAQGIPSVSRDAGSAGSALNVVSALRRCRQPVPARVAIDNGRPVRVTTDRRGFVGGTVVNCAGPWRTSGNWWADRADGADRAGGAGGAGVSNAAGPTHLPHQPHQPYWNRDEWDVALNDGAVYRIFQDRDSEAWFIDAIVD